MLTVRSDTVTAKKSTEGAQNHKKYLYAHRKHLGEIKYQSCKITG